MEQLKSMKQALMAQACSQMGNLQQVDAKELGEVIDMIKDLEEAMYYCTIVKAMEEKENQPQNYNTYYYTEPYDYYDWERGGKYPYWDYERDMDKRRGKMYYSDGGNMNGGGSNGGNNGSNNSTQSNGNSSGRSYYNERDMRPLDFRDDREGKSPIRRRMYMESKEMHQGKEKQMKELERYLQELSTDITEMIEDASPEEKQLLQKKIAVLATKVNV